MGDEAFATLQIEIDEDGEDGENDRQDNQGRCEGGSIMAVEDESYDGRERGKFVSFRYCS